jgi:hypothetical protein
VSEFPTIRFQDLVTMTSVQDLFPNATADQLNEVSARAAVLLAKDPELGEVRVLRGPSHYSHELNSISLDAPNSDELAHEAGHASGVGRSSGLYKSLLALSNRANTLGAMASIPVSASLQAMVSNPETRASILKPLAGISALLAAPALFEETQATVKALASSPEKMRSTYRLLPALLEHYAHGLAAPGVYLGQALTAPPKESPT